MFTQLAESDFTRARAKAFLHEVAAALAHRPNELLSFDAVRRSLKIFGEHYRGVRPVRVSQIVGSTTQRYHDFDRAFLPTQTRTKSRWKSIDRAYYRDVGLPPVQLYQVGEVYYVRDGHHRISVARERGQEFIDAEIVELSTRVPFNRELASAGEEIPGRYAEFLDKTQLDQLRPGYLIRFSEPGGYERLIEHIAVHRYFMGIEQRHPIRWRDAVIDWFDRVYAPVVRSIREHQILHAFPNRTEADLYLWIMDHHYFLSRQRAGVALEQAAVDFAQHYSQRLDKKLLRVVRQAVSDFVGGYAQFQPLVGTMVSAPYSSNGESNHDR